MNEAPATPSEIARTVFLVPGDFAASAKPLTELSAAAPPALRTIAESFLESLHGVVRTLGIPFHYTYSHVQSLHWQHIHMAERIRARSIENEAEREPAALSVARKRFEDYLQGDGGTQIADDVVERLLRLMNDPDSLAAAHQLTKQGVVLTWSAVEVLARDAFVYLLDGRPVYADLLLSDASNKKRFSADRVDWQTLASFGYDLSSNLGTYLISKGDLKNVPAIRSVYGALFPDANDLRAALCDRRLWDLNHQRHLIVHRGGVVDQAYLEVTGAGLSIGDILTVSPAIIETMLDAALRMGTELIREVANAA
jgi:hypothetical protein